MLFEAIKARYTQQANSGKKTHNVDTEAGFQALQSLPIAKEIIRKH